MNKLEHKKIKCRECRGTGWSCDPTTDNKVRCPVCEGDKTICAPDCPACLIDKRDAEWWAMIESPETREKAASNVLKAFYPDGKLPKDGAELILLNTKCFRAADQIIKLIGGSK